MQGHAPTVGVQSQEQMALFFLSAHLALSMEPEQWERIKAKLDTAGVASQQIGRSLYFRDPNGTRLELLRAPLGEMNGKRVL